MHHNNFGNFYTREVYAIPIPMGFPWEWDSHGVSHSHAQCTPLHGISDGAVSRRLSAVESRASVQASGED